LAPPPIPLLVQPAASAASPTDEDLGCPESPAAEAARQREALPAWLSDALREVLLVQGVLDRGLGGATAADIDEGGESTDGFEGGMGDSWAEAEDEDDDDDDDGGTDMHHVGDPGDLFPR